MVRTKRGLARAGLVAAAVAVASFSPLSAGEIEKAATTTMKEAPAASVSQDLLSAAAKDSANFLHTNGNYDQTRYYPGKQIDTSNVASCIRLGSSRPR